MIVDLEVFSDVRVHLGKVDRAGPGWVDMWSGSELSYAELVRIAACALLRAQEIRDAARPPRLRAVPDVPSQGVDLTPPF